MFLILRCRTADTLKQFAALQNYSQELGIGRSDVRCPTYRIERRVGRNRERIEIDVPILGNFLFVRWPGDLCWANYVERKFPFISIMRLPHGGYATCSGKELDVINKLPALPVVDSSEWIADTFQPGDLVEVKPGTFLGHIVGEVTSVRKSGEVRLKVTNSGELKMTTLLVHGSLLTISMPVV